MGRSFSAQASISIASLHSRQSLDSRTVWTTVRFFLRSGEDFDSQPIRASLLKVIRESLSTFISDDDPRKTAFM